MTPDQYAAYSSRRKQRVLERAEEMGGLDEAEKARREKIAKANAGKVPWNRGKKHKPGKRRRPRCV